MKKVLIFLGCPESPIQVPLALYTSHRLKKKGYTIMVTANPATLRLLEVADPSESYVSDRLDLDSSLDSLSGEDYDLLVGFIHNDAAVAYFVTFESLLGIRSVAIVFERDAKILEELEKEVKENTNAHIIAARAHHNPTPLKIHLDKFLDELED